MFICMQGTVSDAEPMRFIIIRPSRVLSWPLDSDSWAERPASSRSGQPSLCSSAKPVRDCHSAAGSGRLSRINSAAMGARVSPKDVTSGQACSCSCQKARAAVFLPLCSRLASSANTSANEPKGDGEFISPASPSAYSSAMRWNSKVVPKPSRAMWCTQL
ncbi:hypothetical protein D3C84_519450 [compost metagenome]